MEGRKLLAVAAALEQTEKHMKVCEKVVVVSGLLLVGISQLFDNLH